MQNLKIEHFEIFFTKLFMSLEKIIYEISYLGQIFIKINKIFIQILPRKMLFISIINIYSLIECICITIVTIILFFIFKNTPISTTGFFVEQFITYNAHFAILKYLFFTSFTFIFFNFLFFLLLYIFNVFFY
jgi:hypothetical protein